MKIPKWLRSPIQHFRSWRAAKRMFQIDTSYKLDLANERLQVIQRQIDALQKPVRLRHVRLTTQGYPERSIQILWTPHGLEVMQDGQTVHTDRPTMDFALYDYPRLR